MSKLDEEKHEEKMRHYRAICYLLCCKAKENGGELILESNLDEDFYDTRYTLNVTEEKMTFTIKLKEEK